MIARRIKQRGQNTIEMVFLIVGITLTVVLMQTYLKRAVSGRLRTSLDQLSQTQYDPSQPYNITSRTTSGGTTTTTDTTGTTTTKTTADTTSTRSTHVGATDEITVETHGDLQ